MRRLLVTWTPFAWFLLGAAGANPVTRFSPDRGYAAAIVPTRAARQYKHYWMGRELVSGINAATLPESEGATVGKFWIEAKNTLLATRPWASIEWRSFILLGDPTVRIVPGHGVVVGAHEAGMPLRLRLDVAPNPFTQGTTL